MVVLIEKGSPSPKKKNKEKDKLPNEGIRISKWNPVAGIHDNHDMVCRMIYVISRTRK